MSLRLVTVNVPSMSPILAVRTPPGSGIKLWLRGASEDARSLLWSPWTVPWALQRPEIAFWADEPDRPSGSGARRVTVGIL